MTMDRLISNRLKPDLWQPIANEMGIPWRAVEAMHWAMGEEEMCRRAGVKPFLTTAAQDEHGGHGAGRVAQRNRMLESTRLFEGHELSALTSCFNSNGSGQHPSMPNFAPSMPMPNINNGRGFPGFEEEEDEIEEEDEEEGEDGDDDDDDEVHDDDAEVKEEEEKEDPGRERPRAKKTRRGEETRLPGLAEMGIGVPAFASRGGGPVKIERGVWTKRERD